MKQSERPRQVLSIRHFCRAVQAASLTLCISLGILLGMAPGYVLPSFAGDDAATLRAAAQQQFARAESLRAALEAKTEPQTVKDYTELVSAYRHVMLITPRAPEVPTAIKEIGDLYRSMGSSLTAYTSIQRSRPMDSCFASIQPRVTAKRRCWLSPKYKEIIWASPTWRRQASKIS